MTPDPHAALRLFNVRYKECKSGSTYQDLIYLILMIVAHEMKCKEYLQKMKLKDKRKYMMLKFANRKMTNPNLRNIIRDIVAEEFDKLSIQRIIIVLTEMQNNIQDSGKGERTVI